MKETRRDWRFDGVVKQSDGVLERTHAQAARIQRRAAATPALTADGMPNVAWPARPASSRAAR